MQYMKMQKKKFLERYEKINWNEYHESLPLILVLYLYMNGLQ